MSFSKHPRLLAMILVSSLLLAPVQARASSRFCEGLLSAAKTTKYMLINKVSYGLTAIGMPLSIALVCGLHSCVGGRYEKDFRSKARAEQVEQSRENQIKDISTRRKEATQKLEEILSQKLSHDALIRLEMEPTDRMILIGDNVYVLMGNELHVFGLHWTWRDKSETPYVELTKHLQTFAGGPKQIKLMQYGNSVVALDVNSTNDYRNVLRFFFEDYGGSERYYFRVDQALKSGVTEILDLYVIGDRLVVSGKGLIGQKKFSILTALGPKSGQVVDVDYVRGEDGYLLTIGEKKPVITTQWLETDEPLSQVVNDEGNLIGLKSADGKVVYETNLRPVSRMLKSVLSQLQEGRISVDLLKKISRNQVRDVVVVNNGAVIYVLSEEVLTGYYIDRSSGDESARRVISSFIVSDCRIKGSSSRSRLISHQGFDVYYWGTKSKDGSQYGSDSFLKISSDWVGTNHTHQVQVNEMSGPDSVDHHLLGLYVFNGILVLHETTPAGGQRLSVINALKEVKIIELETSGDLTEVKNEFGETTELQDATGKTVYRGYN